MQEWVGVGRRGSERVSFALALAKLVKRIDLFT